MMPSDMAKYHADIWVNDEGENEDALNNHEADFLVEGSCSGSRQRQSPCRHGWVVQVNKPSG